jgi:hypothetical protein
MVILSIAVSGTAAAMIYGREILNRQEHYKAAAYLLKGELEKKQWEIVALSRATTSEALQATTKEVPLTILGERGSGGMEMLVRIDQKRIEPVYVTEIDPSVPAYYVLEYDATWLEPEMAGSRDQNNYQERTIKLVTAVSPGAD